MAGDWIKVEIDTAHKPEVLKLARILGIHKAQAFGLVVTFWGWCDKNTSDGEIVGVTEEDVDIFLAQPGFAKALQNVDWLKFDPKGPRMLVPSFQIHNSESAKRRAQKTRRQQKWRSAGTEEKPKKPKRLNGSPVGFDSFYDPYPRHEKRADAEKAWIKIAPDEALRERIVRAVEAQKRSPQWLKDNGAFIPHPASWLNAKRWEDESAPVPVKRVAI